VNIEMTAHATVDSSAKGTCQAGRTPATATTIMSATAFDRSGRGGAVQVCPAGAVSVASKHWSNSVGVAPSWRSPSVRIIGDRGRWIGSPYRGIIGQRGNLWGA
jgi:hypothetical protein